MAPASRSFLSSFWDSINDLSPRKKPPPSHPHSPTSATAALSSTPTINTDTNKGPSAELEAKRETQSDAVDTRDHTAVTATDRALTSPPPQPPTWRRTRTLLSNPHSRKRKRHLHTSSAVSSSSLPKSRNRATAAATRTLTHRAATTKSPSSASSDPYDMDSVVWEEERKQQQEEQEYEENLDGDHEWGEDANTYSKTRSKPAAQPKKKTTASRQNEPGYYEIERILGFRRLESESTLTDAIELLVHWAGYDDRKDQTWEHEDELQLTARDAVLEFWESHPMGCRDAALGINASDSGFPYRALRVVGGPKAHGRKAAGTSKGSNTKIKKRRNTKKKQAAAATADEDEIKAEFFRVEWVGYRANTWEPRENLPEAMIQAYLDDRKV